MRFITGLPSCARFAVVVLATLAATTLVSCETFDGTLIDPFEGQNRYFTIYGFLDVSAVDHNVRIIPVRRTPEHITSETDANAVIDATVASIDLETGQRILWRHRLTPLADGTFAHIYSAAMRVEPGHPYVIEVTRSDSAQSVARTVVPTLSTSIAPLVDAPVVSQGTAHQTVHLTGIPRAIEVTVLYNVTGNTKLARVARPYGTAGRVDAEGWWTLDVDLSRDAIAVLQAVESELGMNVALHEVGVSVRWIDDQWPLNEGVVDIDRLAQPGVLSNVENGDGFFGSIGTYSRFWSVTDPELKALLGFE